MTRKQYVRRMQELVIAIYRKSGEEVPKGRIGCALRYTRDHAKIAPAEFGSYQNAWDRLKEAREFFGVR